MIRSILRNSATLCFVAVLLPGPLTSNPPAFHGEKASAVVPDSVVEFWQYEDLKALDPWGDSTGDAHDLIAVYEKDAGEVLHFRVDVMDVRAGAKPDLYVAVDYKPGGTSALSPDQSVSANIEWDLLLSLSSNGEAEVLGDDFTGYPAFLESATFDTTLDYAEFAVRREALPDWDGASFTVQALALNDAGTTVDTIPPVDTDATTGRGKLVLVFGNMFSAGGPASVSWYDGFAFPRQDHPEERHGYKYLLDAAEKYSIPLTLIDLRIETLPGLDYLGVVDRLRELADRGLLDLVTTTTYGYYMPWQPADVDARMLRLAGEQRAAFGLPRSDVLYPYEAWLTAEDLSEIHEAGYSAIYAVDRYSYWFGWIKGTDWTIPGFVEEREKLQRKIHKINGMQVFFGLHGFFWDARWNNLDIEPGWYFQHYDSFVGTDEGFHHGWRRALLDMALDADQEQYITMGTDLWLTSWYFQGDAERSMRWLAAHPWIEVTTFNNLLTRRWTLVDHGDLGLAPEQPLDRYTDNRGHSSGDYFWQSYYGGISDGHSPLIPAGEEIESYFDYVPYLNGSPISTGMKMGDDKTPGTIIYETLDNLRAAPDNALTFLAWYAYFLNIPEQTFHASKVYESGENALGDPGGRYLHPGAKAQANHIRQVNKIIAAAQWAEQAMRGEVFSQTELLKQDLDLDGEDEFVMKNNRVFLVFENDGGRLEYAFAYSAEGGLLQWVGPIYQFQISGYNNFKDGETPPTDWAWLDGAFNDLVTATGERYYSVLYDATLDSATLIFTSPDGRIGKTFTLDGATLHVHYQLHDLDSLSVGLALTPNAARFYSPDWWAGNTPIQASESIGWQEPGGSALLDFSGLGIEGVTSFMNDSYRSGMREPDPPASYSGDHWLSFPFNEVRLTGQEAFDLSLTLSTPLIETPFSTIQPGEAPLTSMPSSVLVKDNPLALIICGGLLLIIPVITIVLVKHLRKSG